MFCPSGLANRLRVLVSGLALAEATGRNFKMLWPLTPACAAPFEDLFTNNWPVETVAAGAVTDLPYVSGWFGRMPDLLTAQEINLIIGHPSWLIRPEQFPGHQDLLARSKALFAALQPATPIQQQIEVFCRHHFRPSMIGVHLRRGDLLRARPDTANNTAQALVATEQFLQEYPEAGILLCTDDGAPDPQSGRLTQLEGVRTKFTSRYGARIVSPAPGSLDRSSSLAVKHALVEFYLLRACDAFVGTQGSSFSEMVVFGAEMPNVLAAGATAAYTRLEHIARLTGLHALLSSMGQQQLGKQVPFSVLFRYYSRAPLRRLRRLLTNVAVTR